MAKGANDVVNILYLYIRNIPLMTAEKKVNGGLYKYSRPINSTLEDVVINPLAISGEDVQEGVAVVNIYVPNINLNLNGLVDSSQPNTKRITELTNLAIDSFLEFWPPDGDYCFEMENNNVFPDENNQHYISIRIRFYSPLN